MRQAFVNCRLLRDGAIHDGEAVLVEDGTILDIVPDGNVAAAPRRHDLGRAILSPGLIDIQVNGGGGLLFNDAPTVEGIRAIGAAHARYGTTGFLPTLISTDNTAIARAMTAVDAAMDAGVPGVLGLHVEGPFLSHARKGIHDAAEFRPLDEETLALLTRPRRGCIVLTVAPEIVPPATIRALTQAGVLVCAGHTDADFATVRAALDAGLRGFTHLFNAMSQLTGRNPGTVGAALADRQSWCGIIADGHHVHPASLQVARAAKGPQKLILVTDAMPSVGARARNFRLQGQEITVADGACRSADGTLAGSDLDMIAAVRNSMTMLGLSLPEAVGMASANAATFLRLANRTGAIAPGLRADFIVLDDALAVTQTWIGGERQALPPLA